MSRDEGYLISRNDQLSVVRNSHTTAEQNSKLCVSKDEGYLISRIYQLSVVRNSHTTAAQNSRLRVSRGESCLISKTGQTSVMRNSHTKHRSAGANGRNTHFRASRKNIDRIEGSNQNDCAPVQYSRYPTEEESTQLKYLHGSEQTEGPRRQGQVKPSVQQLEVSTLAQVDARESGGSARSRLSYGEMWCRKSTERMVQQWHV